MNEIGCFQLPYFNWLEGLLSSHAVWPHCPRSPMTFPILALSLWLPGSVCFCFKKTFPRLGTENHTQACEWPGTSAHCHWCGPSSLSVLSACFLTTTEESRAACPASWSTFSSNLYSKSKIHLQIWPSEPIIMEYNSMMTHQPSRPMHLACNRPVVKPVTWFALT